MRDEGNGIVTSAYKERLGVKDHKGASNDEGMKEVEIIVNDFEKTVRMFKEIGFIEKHYAEKKRIKWMKDDIEFDIETYPVIGSFLEIESTSWEKVNEGIKLLGLNPDDKKIYSGNQLFATKGYDVGKLKRISFEEGLVEN